MQGPKQTYSDPSRSKKIQVDSRRPHRDSNDTVPWQYCNSTATVPRQYRDSTLTVLRQYRHSTATVLRHYRDSTAGPLQWPHTVASYSGPLQWPRVIVWPERRRREGQSCAYKGELIRRVSSQSIYLIQVSSIVPF